MSGLVAAMALAAPLVLADEKSLLHLPEVEDFRVQPISRADNEKAWPFTVDEGFLLCAYVLGSRAVYFTDKPPQGTRPEDVRITVISENPVDIIVARFAGMGLIDIGKPLEELIRTVAPFKAIGDRLCDQPRGAIVRPGEL